MRRISKKRLAIALTLFALIVALFLWQERKMKERVLRDDLFSLRQIIDEYTYDNKKAPQSLHDLVKAEYVKSIPADPMTGRADWQTTQEETIRALDQTEPGIVTCTAPPIKSGRMGTAYSTW